jgi:hypothetical protein
MLCVVELVLVAGWICAGVEFRLDTSCCDKAAMGEGKKVAYVKLGAKEAFMRR